MRVEHQGLAAAASAGDQHGIEASVAGILDMRFQAILSSPFGDEFSHGRFAGAARHQVGIHRVDGDEIGEEGDEFVHCVWLSQVKCEAGFWRICAIRAIRIAGCANAESQYLC